MCCTKEVSELPDCLHCPIVSLLGSGMGSTGVNMITKNITDKLFATTTRDCQLCPSDGVVFCAPTQVAKKDYQRLEEDQRLIP